MDAGPKPLHELTADKVGGELLTSSLDFLPPLRTLCRKYQVSLRTMSKAIQVLKERGVIRPSRSKKLLVVKKDGTVVGADVLQEQSSEHKFYAKLKDAIETGVYRAREALPKVTYFVISDSISNTTVCETLKRLEAEHLIHKQGRRWIVGPSERDYRVSVGRKVAHPTVLILVCDYTNWRHVFDSHLLRSFAMEFCAELDRYGIAFRMVQKEEMDPYGDFFPSGRRGIMQVVSDLGDNYRGTLIAGHYARFPDIKEWADWLCQFKGPVVWLDDDNAAPHMDRRGVDRKNYFHCASNQRAVVRVLMERIHTSGHRLVVIPRCVRYAADEWLAKRIALITEEAAALRPAVAVEVEEQEERQWKDWDDAVDDAVFAYAGSLTECIRKETPSIEGSALSAQLARRMRDDFPSLARLAERKGSFTVLAANQWLAINYYYWFQYVGVSVPRDMSLVTVDNVLRFSRHPVSTADPGLIDIGYSAAHILIGDVPVRLDRRGNVTCTPRFIDRGSLGAARRQ